MRADGSEQRRVLQYSTYRGVTYKPESYHDIAVSPDGAKTAMVSWHDHQLYIVHEDSTLVRVENDGLKIQKVVWAADSSKLACAAVRSQIQTHEQLWVIREDGTDKKQVGSILAESGFAWSPDNQHIATIGAHRGRYTVNIINTLTSEARTIAAVETDTESQNNPNCPEWSPDGRYILYTTFAKPYTHIYRADIAEGRIELILGDEGAFRFILHPSWH